jgi:hypothetical protein
MKKFDQVNEIQDLYDKRKAAILKHWQENRRDYDRAAHCRGQAAPTQPLR